MVLSQGSPCCHRSRIFFQQFKNCLQTAENNRANPSVCPQTSLKNHCAIPEVTCSQQTQTTMVSTENYVNEMHASDRKKPKEKLQNKHDIMQNNTIKPK